MALRKLKAESEKRELLERREAITAELDEIKDDLDELITRSEKIDVDGTDEQKQALLEEDDVLEERKTQLTAEQEEITQRLSALEEELKTFGKGEKVDNKVESLEVVETRDALNAYLHKKDLGKQEVRAAGLVSEDAEVLIPEEIIYQPRDEVYTEQDLDQYINQVSVSTRTGKWPVMLRTSEKMHTVAELNANPALQNPKFREVNWDVETYRGYIPISQEAIDDTAVDLLALVARHILRIVLNTTNSIVAPLIQNYQSAIAQSLDDLKKLDDTMLDPAYQRAFYMSRSMYHYLNTMKDSHGDYILQPDVTSPSGKVLFGHNVIRINDNLIGQYNGQLVCFFGDLKAAITKFNRKTISAQWDDHNLYDTNIQSGFRAGYSVCDEKAGFYVLFAPPEKDIVLTTSDEQTPETVEGVEATIAVENNVITIKFTGAEGKTISYALENSKGAVVAAQKGRFDVVKTEDTITITFAQDMVKGDYVVKAKVNDGKSYKVIKQTKLNIKQKSDEAAKILNGTPIVIANE